MLSAYVHAPAISSFSCCLSWKRNLSRSSMASSSVRIAVVGDIHDCWNLEEDSRALEFLQVILGMKMLKSFRVLQILNFLKQLYWETMIPGLLNSFLEGVKLQVLISCPSLNLHFDLNVSEKDKVQLQLECLGKEHVAYQRLDFPMIKVSVVGGRPFSSGGKLISRKKLLSARYGVKDMDGSAKRIHKAALGTPEDHFLILLAHNGPTGLGSALNDICGKDWEFEGDGDHGDPDLEHAISLVKENNQVSIPLVVFGHMHKELAYGNGFRKMIVVGADNTIYLNGAIVPRVKSLDDEDNRNFNDESALSSPEAKGSTRAFTLVEISEGRVAKIAECWVSVVEDRTTLEEEHILFEGSLYAHPPR